MRLKSILRLRLTSLLRRDRIEQDLDEELRYHVDRQTEENIRNGMSAREARRAALLDIRGFEQVKEECRDMRGFNFADDLAQDIRFAARQCRRNAGFTITAVLMLALGLCASVAIFAFVDATLIKPLPYHDPSRLVGVFESVPMFPRSNLSYPDYLDWKKMQRSFSAFDVYQQRGSSLRTSEGSVPVRGARVSDGFFKTLGVKPVLGRDFVPGEDLASAPRIVMLTYASWQNRFGARADVLGREVVLDGQPHTIVGVLPREFHFAPAEPAEFWTTLRPSGGCDLRRSCHGLYGVARLKDGVTLEAALADVTAIAKVLERQYPDSNRDQGAALADLSEVIGGELKPILLILLAGAVLLLFIASVNVASLLLIRSESRRREIAVRNATGASRSRLVRQFATEGLVLVILGSIAGLVFAQWTIQLLSGLIPEMIFAQLSYLHEIAFNGRVLGFAGIIAFLAALLFCITPTLRLSSASLTEGLAEGSRGSSGRVWARLGSKLVVVEFATAMVLLVSAAMLGKSLYHLLQVDIGFRPERLAFVEVAAPRATYSGDKSAALYRRVVQRVAELPGVQSVGLSSQSPVSSNGNTTWLRVLGRPYNGERNETPQREVTAAYFTTIGARLLRGRFFADSEDSSKPPVAIVNEAFAKLHFPNENAVGKHLSFLSTPPVPMEIVGVVADIKEGPLDTATPPVLYLPIHQSPSLYFWLFVHTRGPEETVLGAIPGAIREIDKDIITAGGMRMRDAIETSPAAYLRRCSTWVVGGFALLSLLLGVVGLYGVVAYSVSQRTREIGVRIALGAQRGWVYRLILREAGALAAVGILVGVACSAAAARGLRALLFGVNVWDISTVLAVGSLLAMAACLASYIPARRAASVNPVEALRAD